MINVFLPFLQLQYMSILGKFDGSVNTTLTKAFTDTLVSLADHYG